MLIRCPSTYVFCVYIPIDLDVETLLLQNHVYDEHSRTLQIYWSNRDVISWLAENSDDEHLKKVHQTAEITAVKMEVASRSFHDEKALFDEDDEDDGEDEIVLGRSQAAVEAPVHSKQRVLSMAKVEPIFEGLKTPAAGHKIQEIRELMTVPVRESVSASCVLRLTKFS